MRIIFGIILASLCLSFAASASTVTSATLSVTNSAALTNATSGQSYTLNGDTRTFTNSVANAAAQILIHTNDSASTIALSLAAQAGSYPFTGLQSLTMGSATNVTFRMAPDTALTITLSPTNWGRVTYSTQTVGTAQTVVQVPFSAYSSEPQTNIATLLWSALDAYSQSRDFGLLHLTNGLTEAGNADIGGRLALGAGLGLHGTAKTNSYTITTNDLYVGVDTRSNTNLILTLPSAASASNLLFFLKDEGGACATNTLKIYPQSGDRIDTLLTNLVVSNNFGGVMLRSRGSTNWAILASGGGVTGGIAGSGGGVPLTNSVWIAKNGNNTTGARGDASKPYLTLGAAKTNAVSGDTIFVLPGTYDEKNLLKDGVNWHFFSGSIVNYTGAVNGAIFDDTSNGANGPVVCSITGLGQFSMAPGSLYPAVDLEDASSVVSIEGVSITAEAGGTYQSSTSTLTITDALISAPFWYAVQVNGADPVTILNRCKLQGRLSGSPNAALKFSSANTNSLLRDCVLISEASTPSIKSDSSGTQVRIEGGLTSTTGPDANVLIVTSEKLWYPAGRVALGTNGLSDLSYFPWLGGTVPIGSDTNNAVDFRAILAGSSEFGNGTAVHVSLRPSDASAPAYGGTEAFTADNRVSSTSTNDRAIYGELGAYAIEGIAHATLTNQSAGVLGYTAAGSGPGDVTFGVVGNAQGGANGVSLIGVGGSSLIWGAASTNVGGYFEVAADDSDPPDFESAVLLLDNRTTGVPLLIARSNTVPAFVVNPDGSISMTTQTNRIADNGSALTFNGSPIATAGANTYATYAAGTAYSMTTTYTNIAFGTTSPTITIATAGTYLINANVGVKYNGLTYVAAQTATVKVRRTNNTPADITNAARTVELPVLTTFTGGDVFPVPPVIYTATAGDVLELYGNVSGSPGAGSVNADSAEIVAVRIQ